MENNNALLHFVVKNDFEEKIKWTEISKDTMRDILLKNEYTNDKWQLLILPIRPIQLDTKDIILYLNDNYADKIVYSERWIYDGNVSDLDKDQTTFLMSIETKDKEETANLYKILWRKSTL